MEATHERLLVSVLLALTFVTGIIDAVSFLALGQVFTANMTGNVALLGFASLAAGGFSVPRSGAALAFFFVGAMAGGRMGAAMSRGPARRWIAAAFAVEAILVLAAAVGALGEGSDIAGHPARVYALIILLALAMGSRNATVRKLGMRDLTTTVLTLTLADLGRSVAVPEGHAPRWQRATASLLLMLCGAAAGALMLRHSVALALLTAGAAAAACAVAVALAGPDGPPPAAHPAEP